MLKPAVELYMTDRQGSVLQVVRSTGEAVGRYRYEGVKPATVQEHEAGDPLRLRAELLLTVAGQPNLPDVNLLYIRGQWYSGLTDTALNASGSVAVNPYPVMGATAVNEPAGSWLYRNIWSPLGSALSDPRMALFGVLDGLTLGVLSWATDKLTLTNSKGWTDDEKAAFGAGSVVGMIGSAVLTGGATAALRGAAAAAKAAETAVTLSRAAAVGRGYVQASAANGLYTAGEGVAKAYDEGLGWQSGLMIGGGLLGARLDLGGLAKAGQLGSVGRGLLGATKVPERATLAVLKPVGKVAKALAVNKATKAIHGKAFDLTERVLDKAVHGGLAKISTRAHDAVADQLNRLGFRVCFAADMPMRTAGGHVLSQDVRKGTRLLSRDEWDANGAVTEKVVEAVFVREGLVVEVVVNGVAIRTTAEHPLFRFGDGWTAAHELRVGDTVRLEEGWATVEKVIDTGSWETVYNFRVADFHTYFVGCDEWGFSVWAHNAAAVDYTEPGIRALGHQTNNFDKAALAAAGLSPAQITKVRGLARNYPSIPNSPQSPPLLARAGYRGKAGDPAHQATIGRLETLAKQEFPDDVYHLGTSIRKVPGGRGLHREPDVWVEDAITGRLKKVYEAARKDVSTGDWVLRERLKQADYRAKRISHHFEEVS